MPIGTIGAIAGVVTVSLALLGALVAVTRYVTRLQADLQNSETQRNNERLQTQFSDLEAKYMQLDRELLVTKRIGTAALSKKQEVEDSLTLIRQRLRADGCSVYIPFRAQSSLAVEGLAFLAIQPFGKEASALRRKIIPMRSLAGQCFTSKAPFVVENSKSDPNHFREADEMSGYQTQDSLNYPLVHREEAVGVLQLLNKTNSRFSTEDLPVVDPFIPALSSLVFDFVRIPDHLELLGIVPDRDAEFASIVFCDMTNSSSLFRETNAATAIHHLNEYLECITEVVFAHKGTVDRYTGDGAFFRFNVPRPVGDPAKEAVKAALEMQVVFQKLRSDWVVMGSLPDRLFNRIGISTGQVRRATIGHPQFQYMTVFGPSVNVAANLCGSADRNRDIIIIDRETLDRCSDIVRASEIPGKYLGKASAFVDAGYEITSV